MRRALPCLVLLILSGSTAAQPPARTHDITPADYASVALVTELAVSPDGKQVAYCLATWDVKADNRKTDLWVVPTEGMGKPRQLTSDRANDRHPKWSADGKSLYVLGNRKKDGQKEPPFNGSPQVWRIPVDGTDPEPVTKTAGGVSGFDYAPKFDNLFYAVDTEVTDEDDFLHLRKKFDRVEYGHGKRKVSEVFRIGPVRGRGELVVAEKRYIRELAVTPNGERLAMITAADDSVIRSEGGSRVDVWIAGASVVETDQSWRKTAASPWPWLESLAWSDDGKRLAYCTIFDGYPAEIIAYTRQSGNWIAKRVKRPEGIHVRGYGSPLQWAGDGEIAFLAESEGQVKIWWVDTVREGFPATSEKKVLGNVMAFHLGRPNQVAYVSNETHTMSSLIVRGANNIDSWLLLNRHTESDPPRARWPFPTIGHITWKAPDGTSVGGVLELPYGYEKGDKKLPLVVAIHGGPTTSSHADLEFDPHNGRLYFSAHGYAVLCPNYRGSTGYGDKFVTDLIGRENDLDVKDILAGIRHLIDQGIVDPERIGVMGWSNGGYLTNCLISMKDCPVKIKAASSGAGIVDTVAEWGFNDEPAYPRVFKKGLPWETPEIYRKTSPTYQLGNVRTPTLIHVGGNDERCPPGHSRMLYRALKEYVGVPTQLVVYPGEPHGLTKLSNRVAKMEWDLAWFDKYLQK